MGTLFGNTVFGAYLVAWLNTMYIYMCVTTFAVVEFLVVFSPFRAGLVYFS